jgi:hypothetical protein
MTTTQTDDACTGKRLQIVDKEAKCQGFYLLCDKQAKINALIFHIFIIHPVCARSLSAVYWLSYFAP